MDIVIKLAEYGTNLSTRDKGREIREIIEKHLNNKTQVHIILDGVDLMSSGFTDELFGKISTSFNWDFLREFMIVKYPSNETKKLLLRSLISKAVSDRKNK